MALENQGVPPITLPATTGLTQHSFVSLNTSGKVVAATAGAACIGVLCGEGTTNSTRDVDVLVQYEGVAKVKATGTTLSAGDQVVVSTAAGCAPSSAGDYVVGVITRGSSGTAGRIVSVLLLPIGTT